MKQLRRLTVLASAAALAIYPTCADGASRTATRTADGNWSTPNWTFDPPYGPPPPNPPNFPDNGLADDTFIANLADFIVTAVPVGGSIDVSGLDIGFGGALNWTAGGGATVVVHGGPVNNGGAMRLNDSDTLGIDGTVDLSGGGFVEMSAPTSTISDSSPGTGRLLISGHTIRGQGRIGFAGGNPNITNSGGLISANVGGASLTINLGADLTQTNGGKLLATGGGILALNGGFINNAGGSIEAEAGSTVNLSGPDILGGTLRSVDSGQFRVTGVGVTVFDSLALAGGTQVNVVDGADMRLAGTVNNNGVITLQPSIGQAIINLFGAVNLTGNGSIVMQGGTSSLINFANTTSTLELGGGQKIFGTGDIGNGGANSNVITVNGQIFADAPGQQIRMIGAGIINNNLLAAANGGILSIQANNGVNNANGTIRANDNSLVVLNTSNVSGGTIDSVGSGMVEARNGTILRNLTNSADLYTVVGASLRLDGQINNTNRIDMLSAADLLLVGNTTLAGGGTVKLGPGAQISRSGAGPFTLVNLDNTIIGEGTLGGGSISIDNRGTVDANVDLKVLFARGLATAFFINTGTMQASNGGILDLGIGTVNNNEAGVIAARSGSIVRTGAGAGMIIQQPNAQVRAETDATIELRNGAIIRGGRLSSALDGSMGGFDITSNISLNGLGVRLEDLTNDGRIITQAGGATLKNVINRGEILVTPGKTLTVEDSLTLDTSGIGGSLVIDGGGTTNVSSSLLIRNHAVLKNGAGAPNAGVVRLTGITPAGARTAFIQGTGTDPQLTNEVNIEGGGVILGGSNRLRVINTGAIIADRPDIAFDINALSANTSLPDLNNAGGNLIATNGAKMQLFNKIVNTGDIIAEDGGCITFVGANVMNAGGTIRADNALVQLEDPAPGGSTTFSGGTLRTNGTGKISNPGSTTLDGTNSGPINIQGNVVGEDGSNTTLRGSFDFSNAGHFQMRPSLSDATFTINGSTSFSGSGTTSLAAPTLGSKLAIITGATGTTPVLTIGGSHVIEGEGRLGGGGLVLNNFGTVHAKPVGGTGLELSNLTINNATGGLKSDGGTTLRLQNATVNNTAGLIRAENGGTVQFRTGTRVNNGLLQSAGSGKLVVPAANSATVETPFTNQSRLEIQDGATLTLAPGGGFGPTPQDVVNNATITLNAGVGASTLRFDGSIALSGGGTIIMSDSPNNGIRHTNIAHDLVNIDNTIRGAGRIDALINQVDGVVVADGTNKLFLFDPGSNQGSIAATGAGGLEVFVEEPASSYLNGTPGRMLVDVGSRLAVLDGVALVNHGQVIVHGQVTAADFINAGGRLSGSGTINGRVINNGELAPEQGDILGLMTINGDLQAQPDAFSLITFDEIIQFAGGGAVGSDRIAVTGTATLDGAIEVSFADGFIGLPGDSSTVMTFAARAGDVNIVNNTGFNGLLFNKIYTPTSLAIELDGFDGDADLNGIVDIGDFALLATNFNLAGQTWLDGDFDGNGLVDIGDFAPMAANFNQSIPLAPARAASVPEPGGLIVVAALFARRRWRR